MTAWETLALFSSALAAGAINAVAGGGTVLTFPVLLAGGCGAVVANATSSFALTVGTAGSLFGFRRHWPSTRLWLSRFLPGPVTSPTGGSSPTIPACSTGRRCWSPRRCCVTPG